MENLTISTAVSNPCFVCHKPAANDGNTCDSCSARIFDIIRCDVCQQRVGLYRAIDHDGKNKCERCLTTYTTPCTNCGAARTHGYYYQQGLCSACYLREPWACDKKYAFATEDERQAAIKKGADNIKRWLD